MNNHTPAAPDEIAVELIRRGLPNDYAQRAATELADHHHDLVDELRASGLSDSQVAGEASRRLGDTRALVKKTVCEYQRRYWCARWPLLTFLLGPIPLLFLTWVGVWLVAACIGWPMDRLGFQVTGEPDGIISTGEYVLELSAQAIFMFVLPAVVLGGLYRLAKRAAMSWRWIGLAACVLALAAGSIRWGFPDPVLNHVWVNGEPVLADQMLLTVGLFLPDASLAAWSVYRDMLGQILFPIGIAAVMLFRMKQLLHRAEHAALNRC